MMKDNTHKSVMPRQVVSYLNPKARGVYFDGTLGGGGHTEAILEACNYECNVVAVDADQARLDEAMQHREQNPQFAERVQLVHNNFSEIKAIAQSCNISSFDGLVLDLGVSSFQLEDPKRGFSFQTEGPLDMRMNQDLETRACDLINQSSLEELSDILKTFGEEPHARAIAKNIVKNRPLYTTQELVLRVSEVKRGFEKTHPATKVFQALRIAVNQELDHLQKVLHDGFDVLKEGGRFVVISFHSLEDRLVKTAFQYAQSDCVCQSDWPVCQCHKRSYAKVLTKKPLLPTEEEQRKNRRSRSAKMRVAEKI